MIPEALWKMRHQFKNLEKIKIKIQNTWHMLAFIYRFRLFHYEPHSMNHKKQLLHSTMNELTVERQIIFAVAVFFFFWLGDK